ncbi:SWIM zinc finger family protein [Streptomyces sp. NPDC054863]
MSGEHRGARGFPAFAARKGSRSRGQSWWGRAWTEAVEDAGLDEDSLKKGRSFARSGRLGPITLSPGRIATQVYDGDSSFSTVLTLDVLDDEEWELLWEKSAERPAVLAELLDGAVPPDLLESAEDARVRLLPGYGELEPDCDCDSFDDVCAHAAALCYQTAWLLDQDQALLLLLRGRGAQEAVEELKSVLLMRALAGEDSGEEEEEESGGAAAPPVAPPAGAVPAQDVFGRAPVALPALPALPGAPARRDPVSGIGTDPLEQLVADASVRARELLAHVHGFVAEPSPPLDLRRDTVRIAATHPDPRVTVRLARAGGDAEQLERAARAWRWGGSAGLDVLEEAWTPSRQDDARARIALEAGWAQDELPEVEVERNRWTLAGRGLQLRHGRDGRWYPYRQEGGQWWPSATPHDDPADALAELLGE